MTTTWVRVADAVFSVARNVRREVWLQRNVVDQTISICGASAAWILACVCRRSWFFGLRAVASSRFPTFAGRLCPPAWLVDRFRLGLPLWLHPVGFPPLRHGGWALSVRSVAGSSEFCVVW